jgi:hypothetical protein
MHLRAFVLIIMLLCVPGRLHAQSVSLGGSLNVASADDFATRAFQDPWDMNDRTDFGWFLHSSDAPAPSMSNISFSGGIFSASSTSGANLFLLETGNPEAAPIGKFGTNYPINANTHRVMAIRMNITGAPQAALAWYSNTIYDSPANIGAFNLSSGWRTYLINLQSLALNPGSSQWGGTVRSLQFYPGGSAIQMDWVRLVNVDASLCRQITWTGFGGAVDLFLDSDGQTNGNEWLLAPSVASGTASAGCSAGGQGYNLYAGAFAPGTYFVLARPAGGGTLTRSGSAYQVNEAPTMTLTSPSEEGSSDDFATSHLGNAWDMNALSDVQQVFGITGQSITFANVETPGGAPLGSTRVFAAGSTPPPPGLVGDPVLAMLWMSPPSVRIDPNRYRILTVEFGIPDKPRSLLHGSIARIVWRVAGQVDSCVSDDIIFNHRAGANVLDKLVVDMADRGTLKIEQGSTLGWVPGNSASPGLDIFRFDVHEFSEPTWFYVKRIKLAALERVAPNGNYTIRWTASENNGTVTLYRDNDRNPSNGRTQIGSAATSAGAFVWTPSVPLGEYFISADIDDGQGNTNTVYSRWPIVVGAPPLSTPGGLRIIG